MLTFINLNSPLDIVLAKELLKINPWAQKVKFAKTGGEILAIAIRISRSFTEKNNIASLSFNIAKDIQILGNETEIYSIFHNLISNAVKFTPSDGIVKVTWSLKENDGEFKVEDTGVGILEEHIERITERFYRVEGLSQLDNKGAGLGLAIVKHALKRHGSSLKIESSIGKGSIFLSLIHISEPTRPY